MGFVPIKDNNAGLDILCRCELNVCTGLQRQPRVIQKGNGKAKMRKRAFEDICHSPLAHDFASRKV